MRSGFADCMFKMGDDRNLHAQKYPYYLSQSG